MRFRLWLRTIRHRALRFVSSEYAQMHDRELDAELERSKRVAVEAKLANAHAELNILAVANSTLSSSARNATEHAAQLQARLNDAFVPRPCPACTVLQQVTNFHVLAAGSRVKMFTDVGPELPAPKYATGEQAQTKANETAPQRASVAARKQRSTFANEFMSEMRNEDAKFAAYCAERGIDPSVALGNSGPEPDVDGIIAGVVPMPVTGEDLLAAAEAAAASMVQASAQERA